MSALDHACTNSACDQRGKAIPAAFAELAQGKCPTCGEPLAPIDAGLSATAQRVIETYPYPIARLLMRLHEKVDVEARAKHLVNTFTAVLKYQAMVLQSEYLKSDIVDGALTKIIRRELGRPLVSAWVKFVEAALPRLTEQGRALFVPELKDAYEQAETGRKNADQVPLPGTGYYDVDGEFVETSGKLGLVRALVSYRNKVSHDPDQPEEQSRRDLDFYLETLDTLFDTLGWMAEYPLLKRENGKVWRMMGAEPVQVDMPWPEQAGETGLALLTPDGTRALPLFPLFIVPNEYVAEAAANEGLLIYDQDTGKRLI